MRLTLDHAHLFATDIDQTVSFFRTMFGAQIVWDELAAGVRGVRLQLGQAFIHVYEQPPRGPRGGAVHHLGIETDDLDGLVRAMSLRGYVFANPVRESESFKYVMIAGPDDLLIELFQPYDPERWRIRRQSSAAAATDAGGPGTMDLVR